MQTFFLNIYNQIKNKLCEKRNTRATLNKFATLQRTDIMVRKSNKIPPSNLAQNIPNIQLDSNKSTQPRVQWAIKLKEPQQLEQQKKIQVKPSMYTLKILEDIEEQKTQSPTQTQQLIRSQIRLDDYQKELDEVVRQIKFLEEKDSQRKKQFWKHVYTNFSNQKLDKDLSSIIDDDQQFNDDLLNENDLYSMYRSHIEEARDLKYSLELKDYPEISFEQYSEIRRLWAFSKKNSSHVIKTMKLKILEKLLARSFKTLSFGTWLNDEIINAYLQMIDNKATETGQNYKILNSFFAQTTFSKSKDMISRALKRKNISEQNQIIIAINNGNHWFFAKIINHKVIVYDSIPKQRCYYEGSESTSEIFRNILEFSNWFYGGNHEIEVESRYPKQNNSSDCGMFLLCGIKDIVRDYQQWSFCQADIPFKRIQVAKELFDEQITGFDQ